ncbi:MAG: hypothetical protein HY692_08425 [Cyanobacteria bacterium NC_groundwater_1444_Ag_S-0.65um_54_12]|nr:hypothetical protein [Cyanobacteria bacterium NC_groundwater_1444_Ag_S-0.65um_54_12]
MKGKIRHSWLTELLFEHEVLTAGQDAYRRPGGEITPATQQYDRAELLGSYQSSEPPRTFAAYRIILSQLFDAKRQRLFDLLAAEPVMRSATTEWSPRSSVTNANIARVLVPFVVKALEQSYEFNAPPVEFAPAAGFLGTYDSRHHKITLSPQLFGSSCKEFLDTLIHEEIHALQGELLALLNVQRRGRILTPVERAIAQYWKNEEPKYRSALAAGSQMSPDTKRRYLLIGQEFHAWTTGHFVASKLTGRS